MDDHHDLLIQASLKSCELVLQCVTPEVLKVLEPLACRHPVMKAGSLACGFAPPRAVGL